MLSCIRTFVFLSRRFNKLRINFNLSLSSSARNDHFSCFICHGILFEPVTIPCGHSFCRKCISKDTSNTCKSCGVRHLALPAFNVNVRYSILFSYISSSEGNLSSDDSLKKTNRYYVSLCSKVSFRCRWCSRIYISQDGWSVQK